MPGHCMPRENADSTTVQGVGLLSHGVWSESSVPPGPLEYHISDSARSSQGAVGRASVCCFIGIALVAYDIHSSRYNGGRMSCLRDKSADESFAPLGIRKA